MHSPSTSPSPYFETTHLLPCNKEVRCPLLDQDHVSVDSYRFIDDEGTLDRRPRSLLAVFQVQIEVEGAHAWVPLSYRSKRSFGLPNGHRSSSFWLIVNGNF